MGGIRRAAAAVLAGACFFVSVEAGSAQVVAEPALLTAGVPSSETLLPYIAFNDDAAIGGMIRIPVTDDVDIGGRAGVWFTSANNTPYAGADVRWGLLARTLSDGGGLLNLSFATGIGLSEPSSTVWKIPVGFIAGLGFRLAGGDSEIFVHPRLEFGISSGDPNTDSALTLDVGGAFSVTERAAALIDLRFGNGIFGETDNVVVVVGAIWRL
jgi:hypothetical protein